jgi:hypothetical protein
MKTKVAPPPTRPTPVWNETFEVDENSGDEYLNVKCFSEEIFGDENIGSAHVNLEGLVEGSIRDVWVPLEGVNSGELKLKMEAIRVDDKEGSKVCFFNRKTVILLTMCKAEFLTQACSFF